MSEFQTSYLKFDSPQEDDSPANEEAYLMHVPNRNKAHWHHIEDLDDFFTRVYRYHQNHGFMYMFLRLFLQVIEFVFVVSFATFLFSSVNYAVLFGDVPTSTGKVKIYEIFYPHSTSLSRIAQNPVLIVFLVFASIYFLYSLAKLLHSFYKLQEIKRFYTTALHIKQADVDNLTWQEVQQRLMMVQEEQQMCIQKQQLTELDIYNRILRFKNYEVALVSQGLLPPRFRLPFAGEVVYLTEGLKYNMELIFFFGPQAFFANRFHLKDEYKVKSKRQELASALSRHLLVLGVVNLILSPFLFVFQVVHTILKYTELFKREPSALSIRKWSIYARLYLRHLNELPHEFDWRLRRAYQPASLYMDSFASPVVTLFAQTIGFVLGSFAAAIIILTVWDTDVLDVEHLFAVGALFTIGAHICRKLIPDENRFDCPEELMRRVTAQVHYVPDTWRDRAHTEQVRDQFSKFFQYKMVNILEELLSPIVTPFVLIFWMRRRSLEFIDFFRNFTVDIEGVGDVCSFAQLELRKTGNPKWQPSSKEDQPSMHQEAGDGKVELSLMRFAVNNPKWNAPDPEEEFLTSIKVRAQMDAAALQQGQVTQNPLLTSIHSAGSDSTMPSIFGNYSLGGAMRREQNNCREQLVNSTSLSQKDANYALQDSSRFPIRVGPVGGGREAFAANLCIPQQGALLSQPSAVLDSSMYVGGLITGPYTTARQRNEMASLQMSISALYMHELHHQKLHEEQSRLMWETVPDNPDFDDSSYHGDGPHSSVVAKGTPNPQPQYSQVTLVQKGYDSLAPPSAKDIFGQFLNESSRDRKSSASPVSTTQPFLTVPTQQHGNFITEAQGSDGSDSDAPQEFHVQEDSYQVGVSSSDAGISHQSYLYRPPQV